MSFASHHIDHYYFRKPDNLVLMDQALRSKGSSRTMGEMVMLAMVWIATAAFLCSCGPKLPKDVAEAYENLDGDVDFNLHVKPILSDKCFQCHGPDQENQKAGLRLDLPETAYGELPDSPGKFAIKPGNLQKSQLFHRIVSEDPHYRMPTLESKLFLTAHEKAVLIKWIEQKAVYKPHWAFIKPHQVDVPEVDQQYQVNNAIDNFILDQLKSTDLNPSPEAEKELLLRRLSLDLTGLPPTPEQILNFIQDKSDQAYEKQVDRLLASPHYGEKMATHWMDLARYADTHGYQVDLYRNMSPWRDWVIKAFNENLPYDEFIIWQLAGDQLPNPSREQILATGFNRLHPQNLEGGIVDEEFRVAYVADRTDVIGQGLMALTLSCAKCHDHKFDPITQKNYYEIYSFFNNINESGQISWEGATPVPTMMLPTKEQEKVLKFIEEEIEEKEDQLARVKNESTELSNQWIENGSYQKISNKWPEGMEARFELENAQLVNSFNPAQRAKMDRQFSKEEHPVFARGYQGQGILLDGDAWIDLQKIGVFRRNQPFSIGLHIYLPEDLKSGVLFHKGIGARLYSFRGYHLMLKDNKLELMIAHTWPDNAVVEVSKEEIPKERWLQFTLTYDGSSKASGLKVYMDGVELKTEVQVDNLYKDIIFNNMTDEMDDQALEPGLQYGARWRGKGLGGAIVDNLVVYNRELSPLEVIQLAQPEQFNQIIARSPEELNEEQISLLKLYFVNNFSPDYDKSLELLELSRKKLADSMEKVKEVMVMKEMEERRPAYVLKRGLYDSYGEEVFPNTPENILPMPEGLPRNRLGLAKWITHPDHPLTARVAVNRFWQQFFGRGLVKTTEDFGNQGERPSHPELLDWLALQFIESGWDVKAMQKLIVMSATYRQTSKTEQDLWELDKDNIWLARGPSVRLTSEMIRDNALFASGLFNDKIGGESVRPYQPEGLWKTNNDVYVQDTGDKLYRRSLYTIWKRTVPHPTLATFDQPERNECTMRRQKTNTPLQALVLLNDPTYIEAARALGENITKSNSLESGIQEAFTRLAGRTPDERELEVLMNLQQSEYQRFNQNPQKTKGWLTTGEYRIDEELDQILVAANTVVASAIINSDASIVKR